MPGSQLDSVSDAMLTQAAVTLDISSAYINSALGIVERHARNASPRHLASLRRESAWLSRLAQQLEDALANAGAPQQPVAAREPVEAAF